MVSDITFFMRCLPVGLTDDRTVVISDTVSVMVEVERRGSGPTSSPFLDKYLQIMTFLCSWYPYACRHI